MKDNEYKCATCGGIFEKGWTEKEAREEQKDNGWENVECDIVCDDCYNTIIEKEPVK